MAAIALRLFAPVLMVLAMILPGGAWAQSGVAFAKFSPLPVFSGQELSEAGSKPVAFGIALPLLDQTDLAAQVEIDGAPVWVHRADVFVPERERYVTSGSGFRVTNRPSLRFWRSLGVLTEFLARADVQNTGADLEEVLNGRPGFELKLPVYTEDVVDVLGRRPIRLAAVMLPVYNDLRQGFDQARGASHTRHGISFIVDVSGDARAFSDETLRLIQHNLRRPLIDSGDTFDISLTVFSSRFTRGYSVFRNLDLSELDVDAAGSHQPGGDYREPLLKALHGARGLVDDSATSNLVLVLSGADLDPEGFIAQLGKNATLSDPGLIYPENTSVMFAQVTPEPGPDLKTLAAAPIGANEVERLDYSETLAAELTRRILAVLRPGDEKILGREVLETVCSEAQAHDSMCVLPFEATTKSQLPGPPRRAEESDWYSTVVWIVEDGLILDRIGE